MTATAQPQLEAGRVYRTRDLSRWSANAPRLARRLAREGALIQLAPGLYAHPRRGRFGPVPPDDETIIRAFLGDSPFLFTGPERWNALGLGATAVFAAPLVYNTKRTGRFEFGGRPFLLRRVAFPERAPPEWFVVDLLQNAGRAGMSRAELTSALARAVAAGRFAPERLRRMAVAYGTKATQAAVDAAIGAAGA